MPRIQHPRRRAHRKIRAAIEAMERRILLSTITVNTFADQIDPPGSKTVSLRDAIALATKLPGDDSVNVPAGNYKLSLGQLQISDTSGDLTITSAGATIDAQKNSAVLYNHNSQDTVSLRGLTLTGGKDTVGHVFGYSISNDGNLILTACTIAGNVAANGGAIMSDGRLTLIRCTVSNNTGGGIQSSGPLSVIDSTISGNAVGIDDTGSPMSIYDSTIADNTGTGIRFQPYSSGATRAVLANSIIAKNNGVDAPDVAGHIDSLGHNLVGDTRGSTGWTFSDQTGNDFVPIDPRLSPLGHHGGPTKTMVPMAGSPALGGGTTNLIPAGISTDQRRLPRIRNGAVDIGAVQAQPPARIALTAPAAQTFSAGQISMVSLGSFSAPADAGQFVMLVSWGDGSADSVMTLPVAGSLGTLHHRFVSGGTFTPQIAVTDRFGDLSSVATFSVTVTAAARSNIVVNAPLDQTDNPASAVISLRDAIDRANQSKGPVSITFDPAVFDKPTTITLGTELQLSNTFGPISLTGPAAALTISGGNQSRVILVDRGVSAIFNRLTISHGASGGLYGDISQYGGAVANFGRLTLSRCTVSNSTSTSGGDIENDGSLQLTDSQISSGSSDRNGGGIDNGGSLLIQRSTLSGNGSGSGGAVYNSGDALIDGSTLSGNRAYFDHYTQYEVGDGGGIYNSGRLTITNSTLYGNTADGAGGAIENSGLGRITSSTISGNVGDGGGIHNDKGAALVLANDIAAGNSASTYFSGSTKGIPVDVAGVITSLGHNLIGKSDGSSGWIKSDFKGSTAHPMDPHLSPLEDYGGPTQTQFPLPQSPALAAGSAGLLPAGDTTDQRGFARVSDGLVDIGSVQLARVSTVRFTPPATQSVVAGDTAVVQLGSFTDSAAGPYQITVDWGDLSPMSHFTLTTAGALGGKKHTFINTGSLAGTIYFSDAQGDFSASRFSIVSATHPPIALVVNTANDQVDHSNSPVLSLRDAFNIADHSFGPVAITFDPQVFSKPKLLYLFNDGLAISHNTFGPITITAPSAGLTIRGVSSNGDFIGDIFGFGTHVTASVTGFFLRGGGIYNLGTLTISNCRISGGKSTYGGGIYNSGTLTLTGSTISGNTAYQYTYGKGSVEGGGGGGVYNSGTMSITNCSVLNNSAQFAVPVGNVGGGGIWNSGKLTLSNAVISNNHGAGIFGCGSLAIDRCTISGNVGGGINSSGHVSMNDSNVAGNSAGYENFYYGGGAGIYASDATLTNCTISGNSDGGISAHKLACINCTIANNTTSGSGGGINVSRSALLINCTITGNTALRGGGIYAEPVTVNTQGAYPAAVVKLGNTIVAGNNISGSARGPDVWGNFTSLGHNLIGNTDRSSGWTATDLTGTPTKPLLAVLSPLGDHGGPTQTQILLAGSPAIGAGSVALIPKGITTDQRGKPRVVNGKVDIGAVEVQPNENH